MTDFPFDDIEETPAKKAPARKAAPKVEVDEGGTRVGITIKGGSGFDVPWLTPSYPSWAAADEDLSNPDTQAHIVSVMDAVAKINAAFVGKVSALAPAKPQGGAGGGRAPVGAVEPPPGTPEAPGPDWTYKTGVGKTGKPWKAWMPPRGSSEQPVWL